MSSRREKRAQFESDHPRPGRRWLSVVVLFLAGGLVMAWIAGDRGPATGRILVEAVDGRIALPLEQVDDGVAHFYRYETSAKSIDFFVLRSDDGVIRAALDTCDICFRHQRGYRQEGDHMVCNKCGQKFRSNRINDVRGGCNPVPIDRSVDGDTLVISASDLEANGHYFSAGR